MTVEGNLSDAGTATGGGTFAYDSDVTVTATTNKGYNFLGWYNEADEQLSAEESYTFHMELEQTITAKWQIVPEMANFIFTSTLTTCTISSVIDKTVTEIVVPDYVVSINQGAFMGCSQVESITLTFVGGSRKTASDTYQYPFGYIFGTSRFEGASAAEQNYYGSSTSSTTSSTYYIPDSLKSVTVTGGEILHGAFSGCSGLTNIDIPNTLTSIEDYAFYNCIGLKSIVIPASVILIGYGAFADCGGLMEVYITDLAAWCRIDFGNDDANPLSHAHHLYLNRNEIKDLIIPKEITEIKDYAFYGCEGLTSVTIGNSVTSIGYGAFADCGGLKEVHITDLAAWCRIDFGSNPLSYAKHLYLDGAEIKDLTIPSEIAEIKAHAFSGCDGLENVTIESNSIGDEAFSDCSGLTSTTIHGSVTSIGRKAFCGCDRLTSISIPDGVTSIGEAAFSGCSGLESITIPFVGDSKKTAEDPYQYPLGYIFGTREFDGASAVKQYYNGSSTSSLTNSTYYIPDSLKSVTVTGGEILMGAFYNCNGLESIEILDSVTRIGGWAFRNCSGLENFIWNAENCTMAGNSAYPIFDGCPNLKAVTFGAKVKIIPDYAFYGCQVTSIEIPNSVTSIGVKAFYKSGLTNVTIGSGVTSIGKCAFYGCSGLTSVEIPDSATKIGSDAFYMCSGLTSVTIGSGVTSIGDYAFYDCIRLTSVTIGSGVTSIGDYAFYDCSGLKEVHITDLAAWCRIDFGNDEANPLSHAHHLYLDEDEIMELIIPNEIAEIKDYAFYGCIGLTSVMIGDSVTLIGYEAFQYCIGLTGVTIPDSVVSIGACAFYGCSKLTGVTIGDSVASIGYNAFSGCTRLKSAIIGYGVTSIGGGAFDGCRGLQTVYYKGTPADWGGIQIGSDNSSLIGTTRSYFSAQTPTAEEWEAYDYWWHYAEDGATVVLWTKDE